MGRLSSDCKPYQAGPANSRHLPADRGSRPARQTVSTFQYERAVLGNRREGDRFPRKPVQHSFTSRISRCRSSLGRSYSDSSKLLPRIAESDHDLRFNPSDAEGVAHQAQGRAAHLEDSSAGYRVINQLRTGDRNRVISWVFRVVQASPLLPSRSRRRTSADYLDPPPVEIAYAGKRSP